MNYRSLTLKTLFLLMFPTTALAHFPWLDVNESGRVELFFGEDLTDRTYHLPESMADYSVEVADKDSRTSVALQNVSTDSFVGLVSGDQIGKTVGTIEGTTTYGIYHGSKLVYSTQHFLGTNPTGWQAESRLPLNVAVTAGDESETPGGIRVTVWADGKPADGLDVKLYSAKGVQEDSQTSAADGSVQFAAAKLRLGLNAIVVGKTEKVSGSLGDETYEATASYLTATFNWAGKSSSAASEKTSKPPSRVELESVTISDSGLPELPLELTSFGGTVADGKLFVYGGHTGQAHSYSTAEQSSDFWMLDLQSPESWKQLPSGPRLQGLMLVPHGKSVIRMGGFTAMNAEGEEHDLHSQTAVERFDLESNEWAKLPPLPEPRSSFGATAIGDEVFVFGGWGMAGDDPQKWHTTAWRMNLGDKEPEWKSIATPPFQRRAVWVAAHEGAIHVIGGMNRIGGPTTESAIYDPQSDVWKTGPSLVGDPMTGFGCAAESLGGRLYVSTIDGSVQRLSADGAKWEVATSMEPGRFFHCMVPRNESELILVGGANMSIGKFTNIEALKAE